MFDSLRLYGLYSPPGSSLHGILQARTLECVPISSSRFQRWDIINYHVQPPGEMGERSLSKKASFRRQREGNLRSPALEGEGSNMGQPLQSVEGLDLSPGFPDAQVCVLNHPLHAEMEREQLSLVSANLPFIYLIQFWGPLSAGNPRENPCRSSFFLS